MFSFEAKCLRRAAYIAAGTVMSAAIALPASAAEYGYGVSYDRLVKADEDPANWITVWQNYAAHRYSRLNTINRDNVGDLRLKFAHAIGGMEDVSARGGPDNQVTPLVDNGIMYVNDGWGVAYAIDVRNPIRGEFVWKKTYEVDHEGRTSRNRGGALWGDMYISSTSDTRGVAVQRNTGEVVWDVNLDSQRRDERLDRFTAGPLALEDRILFQNTRNRGWLAAVDANDGSLLWRTYTIPAPDEPGGETWKDDIGLWETGAGGLWTTGSYDPDLGLVYWGTGQPSPTYDPEMRPGDNLYTESALAINIEDGSIDWFFQYIPNSSWDYDENGVHFLNTIDVNGTPTNVVQHFARNGFFYTFDRATGSYIDSATGQYVNELNWTAGLDPKTGMPVEYNPSLAVQTYIPATRTLRGDGFERACPTWHGGISMQPPALNPIKQIAYAVGTEGCFTQSGYVEPDPNNAQRIADGLTQRWVGREYTSDLYYGSIVAVDARTGSVVAKHNTEIEIRSGVTATAGGIVFTALVEGAFIAYHDETLEELWRFHVGTPLKGPPVVYEADGKQYVAFVSSARHLHPINFDNLEFSAMVWVFGL